MEGPHEGAFFFLKCSFLSNLNTIIGIGLFFYWDGGKDNMLHKLCGGGDLG